MNALFQTTDESMNIKGFNYVALRSPIQCYAALLLEACQHIHVEKETMEHACKDKTNDSIRY
jgi:hypothetical protein